MKYLLILRQQYSENTSQYGYGDFPVQIEYIGAVVEADTVRKAQNAAKKIYPRMRFGGMFGPELIPVTDSYAKTYLKGADVRLSRAAVHCHREALEALAA